MPTESRAACGCPNAADPPIACLLHPGDFKKRAEQIRDLAVRHLHDAARDGLALKLRYAPESLAEVGALVERERACCPFLLFDLRQRADGVHLTITAPEAAAEAADLIFDRFAPKETVL